MYVLFTKHAHSEFWGLSQIREMYQAGKELKFSINTYFVPLIITSNMIKELVEGFQTTKLTYNVQPSLIRDNISRWAGFDYNFT